MLLYSQFSHLKDYIPKISQQYGMTENEVFLLCQWIILNEAIKEYNAVPPNITTDVLSQWIPSTNDGIVFLYQTIVFLKQLSDVEPFSILPCIMDPIVMKHTLEHHLKSRNEQQNEIALKIVDLQQSQRDDYYHYYYKCLLNGTCSVIVDYHRFLIDNRIDVLPSSQVFNH